MTSLIKEDKVKVILTGGTGFLGSHLLKKMLAINYEVIVLKRTNSKLDRIRSVIGHSNLTLFDLDIGNLEDVFAGGVIDSIVHTATEYGRTDSSIHLVLQTNLVYPIKLIELGIKYGVTSFINTDSYFNKENLFYSHLLNYSLSKRSLISWLHQLSSQINIANVMLEHIYGPTDSETKFVQRIIGDIAIKQLSHVPLTHGHQKRDFVYVDDVVSAYMYLIEYMKTSAVSYSTFQLGTGESVQVRTLAEIIKNISASKSELGFGDIEYRRDEIMDSKADNSALMELGWRPMVSLENGIRKIVEAHNLIE